MASAHVRQDHGSMKVGSIRRSEYGARLRLSTGKIVGTNIYGLIPKVVDTYLLLERTTKGVETFLGIPFWKVFSERYGTTFCQEANLEQSSYEMME